MSARAWPHTVPAASGSARTSTWASASWRRRAATPTRSAFGSSAYAPRNHDLSILSAGEGTPLVCIHGLGGTKASFLPTVSALAPEGFRVISSTFPASATPTSPHPGAYDAPWFARAVIELLDELDIPRAHLAGNSMGGRIAIETGLLHHDRVERMVLLSPALAWLKDRGWKWLLRMPLPQLGFIQPHPAQAGRAGSAAARARRERGLDRRGSRRVPARLPHPQRAATPSMSRRGASTWTSPTARTGCGRGSQPWRPRRCSSGAARTSSCRSPS